jgi:hypothetical protein
MISSLQAMFGGFTADALTTRRLYIPTHVNIFE